MSQQQLAGEYTRAYISSIENGKILPRLDVLMLLARRLGIEPEDLWRKKHDDEEEDDE